MGTQVFKYALDVDPEAPEELHECELELPGGGQILSVEVTSKGPSIFVAGDPDIATETRSFAVVGNGRNLPEGVDAMHYRGTAKVPGAWTWHVFETTAIKVA